MEKVKIGLYGDNGHQVTALLKNCKNPKIEVAAACCCDVSELSGGNITVYNNLEEMLKNDEINLVSLCSPLRSEQAKDAVKCLRAGKNVYAEKPCALKESELDEIIRTAKETGCKFHEMANVAYKDEYESLISLVKSGVIGDVVQVLSQKSYTPNLETRPQDENIDGGLILQVGIYNMRFAEQLSGSMITEVRAVQTAKGNPLSGDLHTAVSFITKHQSGAVGAGISNYLNPSVTFGTHGNETLRVFGTKGFAEITDYGKHRRLCTFEKDFGEFPITVKTRHYFFDVCDELLGLCSIPETIETELHPVRMAIRARENLI